VQYYDYKLLRSKVAFVGKDIMEGQQSKRGPQAEADTVIELLSMLHQATRKSGGVVQEDISFSSIIVE
jgi:hypothetical protein